MKAVAQIKNLNGYEEKNIVLRNLSRIMDIKIIDIDIEKGLLFFLYASPLTFQKVRQELLRIGHPMQSYKCTISSSSK
ncbi:hypothetical protein SAMN04488008_104372 [Maribacter orientalis]|uniref:Heavy-metal-associated domain-containing protein n=1 Tax=Maribacter orientalis TaxID=228957 RepID=A0A1H7RR85_9FLAO|nr:hypothetical protein [Maribacter orientalis]SEL62713.1 hypothetical protein SAMN04488008_104372 [Maribacter orientalis]|tara:strand:- start:655 stop:888 length:234 start_codon:yes stop_codon:yes gene_type:complete